MEKIKFENLNLEEKGKLLKEIFESKYYKDLYGNKTIHEKKLDDSPIDESGLFSDETENFVNPCEPTSEDEVVVSIRVKKNNVKNIYIITENYEKEMTYEKTEGPFDFFQYNVGKIKNTFRYSFQLKKNNKVVYYNKLGMQKNNDSNFNFTIIPDFKTPFWAKSPVMYQIYVDRFFNGDKTNDVKTNEYLYLGNRVKNISNWDEPLENLDICNFYGGDLKGVIKKLDYLEELGIEVIYFNPLFVSPSTHKYDIQDYDYIDPHFGVIVEEKGKTLEFGKFSNKFATMYMNRTTNIKNLEASNELIIELVNLAHKRNIKVIIDGVFNHCGAFSKWLDKEKFYENSGYESGGYNSKDSHYRDFFKWNDEKSYDCWWGHENHPKLNFEQSKNLEEYILEIGKKWVSPPFNIDGWRLDVAEDLGYSKEYNHEFWKKFRLKVKEGNKDAIIIAEHYGNPKSWLEGDEWDSIMNYDGFMEPITWFLTGMQKHSEEFRGDLLCNPSAFENAIKYNYANFSIQSSITAMNQLSNHDHSRFLTRTNMKTGRLHTKGKEEADTGVQKSIMREGIIMLMTWLGSPTIYYGDEAGVAGWTDPDNRRVYPWGREDKELIEFHKAMIKIHKENKSLKVGSIQFLYNEYGFISYGRWVKGNVIIVLVNNNIHDIEVTIPTWKCTSKENVELERLIRSTEEGFTQKKEIYKTENGMLSVKLKKRSSAVLREI